MNPAPAVLEMARTAKLHVTMILLFGSIVVDTTLAVWQVTDPLKFACYFLLAVAASVLKMTVPGIAGRMPFNFVFVLIGLVQLSLAETLLLGCTTVLIERIWHPAGRTTLLDVLLNLSTITVAIAGADYVFHAQPIAEIPKPVLVFLAANVFFLLNTLPAATVAALTESRSMLAVWKDGYARSYPLYLTGAVVAWAFDMAARYAGWQAALLTLPVAYLLYRTYSLHVARVEDEKVHAEELASLHLRTIEALALAIEAKDNTTHDHLKRVQIYAVEIGRELGLSEAELEALEAAAVLHDIGKLAVPEHIISKPGKLTPEEFEKMKIHPIVGAEILEQVQFPYPVVPIVRAHHEKWNGTGYPYGLRGEGIPIGARILAVVDALDALASDRQYRRALPVAEAMSKVAEESGRSFDPRIVDILNRRYVELERKAQKAAVRAGRLSTGLKIASGAAPAAGFAEATPLPLPVPLPEAQADGWLTVKAQARQDVWELFERTNADGGTCLEETFALFSVRIGHFVPHETIAVYFVSEDKLIPRYVSGENQRLFHSLRIPLGQGLSGWVAENRKPILNGNPSVESGYLNNPNVFSTLRSALALPLIGTNGAFGVLTFYHEGRDTYRHHHLQLAQAITPRFALWIERSLLQGREARGAASVSER